MNLGPNFFVISCRDFSDLLHVFDVKKLLYDLHIVCCNIKMDSIE